MNTIVKLNQYVCLSFCTWIVENGSALLTTAIMGLNTFSTRLYTFFSVGP